MSNEEARIDSQAYLDRWHAKVPVGITRPALLGLVVFVVGVMGFAYWASTAELSSAAVARGSFIATGSNKTIQHLEGGIIKEIRAAEGELVEKGAPLVILDDTSARAELKRLELKRATERAIADRLDAERQGKEKFTFDTELSEQGVEAEIAAILDAQQEVFAARLDEHRSEIKVIQDRIDAIRQEIRGLDAQKTSVATQIDLLTEEIDDNEKLLEKGLTKRSRFLALKRAHAELTGKKGKLEADIGRAKERITESESQVVHLKSVRRQESMTKFRETKSTLGDIEERIKSARDVLTRVEIKAPVRGIIVKMHQNTTGGVVASGEDILELLPADERLIVEAQMRPDDIDQVRVGLEAQMRLIALNQRTTPTVSGKVVYVSADAIEGKQPGEIYYLARIQLQEEALARVKDLDIAPGMPVEVFVQTGQRTFFEYLMKPITDSFARAFKES